MASATLVAWVRDGLVPAVGHALQWLSGELALVLAFVSRRILPSAHHAFVDGTAFVSASLGVVSHPLDELYPHLVALVALMLALRRCCGGGGAAADTRWGGVRPPGASDGGHACVVRSRRQVRDPHRACRRAALQDRRDEPLALAHQLGTVDAAELRAAVSDVGAHALRAAAAARPTSPPPPHPLYPAPCSAQARARLPPLSRPAARRPSPRRAVPSRRRGVG